MKIYSLNKLIRDPNQGNLYSFFDPTFKIINGYQLYEHIVTPEQEMRIDLISQALYKDVDHCDFLLNFNDIDNPLNIMQGDTLLYADISTIPEFHLTITDNTNARATLLNANKSTRIDNNRKKYIEQNYSLPPTFLETPQKAVRIENDQIVIGG